MQVIKKPSTAICGHSILQKPPLII